MPTANNKHTGDAAFQSIVHKVLDRCWQETVTVQSGFARTYAQHVAAAASLQLITTQIDRQVFGNQWKITTKGLRWLNETKECAS